MPRVDGKSAVRASSALALVLFLPSMSHAEERAAGEGSGASTAGEDRFSVSAQSETYLQLYERALVPGPYGAVVPTETAAPIHEYLRANAQDLDSPWDTDSIDLEFAAWARLWPTKSDMERPFDGDVQTASVRYRNGPAWVRLGRQQVAGGAARFGRFDGVMLGANHQGLFVEGYGGFTVLPRWNERPGYHELGDLEETLLLQPGPAPERPGYWLAGGRVGYTMPRLSGSLSLHEERRTGDVDRRAIGVDVGGRPVDDVSVGASTLVDLDGLEFADTRFFIDTTPHRLVDVGAELMRAVPGALLSKQSVLSVFSDSSYDEIGGRVTVRALPWLRFDTNGFLVAYEDDEPGARAEVAARLSVDRRHPTIARVAYARLVAPDNGYQSVRVSLSRELSRRIAATLEAYGYFYDDPIDGAATSSLYAGTVSYRVADPFELLWSGSLAHSQFAALDAQTMLRATYSFDAPPLARRR